MVVQHANNTNQSTLLHAISVTATAMLMMTFFPLHLLIQSTKLYITFCLEGWDNVNDPHPLLS